MKRYLYAVLALALLAGPIQAQENHNSGIGFSQSNLIKRTFNAGRSAIEIFAGPRVEIESLLAGIDPSKAASVQSISDRVNSARKLLFPNEEIILSITPPQKPDGVVHAEASLVQAIFWWNNSNCSTCYWYAQYTSSVATMFIDDIQFGAYDLYDRVGSGGWVYRYYVSEGGSATRYSYGSKVTRGFKGAASGVDSKADIVMYFFK
jgi:hypothetical protein